MLKKKMHRNLYNLNLWHNTIEAIKKLDGGKACKVLKRGYFWSIQDAESRFCTYSQATWIGIRCTI